jgi:hypothetical protein
MTARRFVKISNAGAARPGHPLFFYLQTLGPFGPLYPPKGNISTITRIVNPKGNAAPEKSYFTLAIVSFRHFFTKNVK